MSDTATPDPVTTESKPIADNPTIQSDSSQTLPSSSTSSPPPPPNPNVSNTIGNITLIPPPQPPTIQTYTAASYLRPAPPVPSTAPPQFSPVPLSSAYSIPGVLPPGVSGTPPVMMPPPPPAPGAPQPVSASTMLPYAQPGQPMRSYGQPQMITNPYPGMPHMVPPGALPPPGMVRYNPYMQMVTPGFQIRPPGAVTIPPPLTRPPIPGLRAPIISIVKPVIYSTITPVEKPQTQTTVYVGKIASTVEDDFIQSILQLCGPVKSWKRAQMPSGTLKGFGFCEFESAEGVLRAKRLLSKLNIDGQELMLNVNDATKVYLQRYVEKKIEEIKNEKESESEKEEKNESKKVDVENQNIENHDPSTFGLVTDQDREADQEALKKLKDMIEERLKKKPLPPPPPPPPRIPVVAPVNSNSVVLKEVVSDTNVIKKEEKNEDELTETSSPDRNRGRDRERDSKREKERELERNEKEREQNRAKMEKDREYKTRDDERRYKAREKDWEARERDQEHRRKREREREKERAQERKWEIIDQEHDNDDHGYTKKRKYRSGNDEDRKRRLREKEDDLADKLREEEEIAESKKIAEEQHRKQQIEALKILSRNSVNGSDKSVTVSDEKHDSVHDHDHDNDDDSNGEGIMENGESEINNAPARKLGFGLTGSGKRTAVPSVFNEDEEEDARKEKKMRTLVPLDYTNEEEPEEEPPLVVAAEFAKKTSKEEDKDKDKDKERSRRHRGDRDRDRRHHHGRDDGVAKGVESKKLLDAKQLIDMIPKTKEELFSYAINWEIYEEHNLHERMKPWISKKITEFLGEEEPTLVDFVMSTTHEHVKATTMLENLQPILDEEAEMFVLKMWRMLIFEIKKVETGLAFRSKA